MNNVVFMKSDRASINNNAHIHANVRASFNEQDNNSRNSFHRVFTALIVNILGGCERTLKTPVRLIYTIVLKTLLILYFLLLPLEITAGLTWWTNFSFY